MSPFSSRNPLSRPRRIPLLAALGMAGLASVAVQPAQAQLVDAIRNLDKDVPATIAALPKLLSQTGLYKNIGNKATRAISDTNAIVSFEVNNALWSDGSHKERYISVPTGMKVTPTDSALFTFPDNTVLIKNFAIDTIVGNAASSIYIETRFLVYQSTGSGKKWTGISYKWKRDQSDAELNPTDMPLDTSIRVILNGAAVGKRWHYPSMEDCASCHKGDETSQRGTLGFITPQLNRALTGGVNQLARLAAKNVLTVNPLVAKPNLPRWYGMTETSASLEQRARSYFASNCSHCHGNNVLHGQAAHNFDYFNPAKKITYKDDSAGGWVGRPPLGTGEYPSLIHPGRPDSSFILAKMMFRWDDFLSSANTEQMPPIATSQVDSASIKVIRDWICSLKPGTGCTDFPWLEDGKNWDEDAFPPIAVRPGAHGAKAQAHASIRGGMLILPSTLAASGAVELRDSHGRLIPLRSAGNSQYRLPADLRAGAYLVRAGSYSTLLHYLP